MSTTFHRRRNISQLRRILVPVIGGICTVVAALASLRSTSPWVTVLTVISGLATIWAVVSPFFNISLYRGALRLFRFVARRERDIEVGLSGGLSNLESILREYQLRTRPIVPVGSSLSNDRDRYRASNTVLLSPPAHTSHPAPSQLEEVYSSPIFTSQAIETYHPQPTNGGRSTTPLATPVDNSSSSSSGLSPYTDYGYQQPHNNAEFSEYPGSQTQHLADLDHASPYAPHLSHTTSTPKVGYAPNNFHLPRPPCSHPGHVRKRGHRICDQCGAVETPWARFRLCGGCLMTQYCSRECQKIHWPGHKAICQYAKSQTAKFAADNAVSPGENVAKNLRKFTSVHSSLLVWAGFQALQLKHIPSNIRQNALWVELTSRNSHESHRRFSISGTHIVPRKYVRDALVLADIDIERREERCRQNGSLGMLLIIVRCGEVSQVIPVEVDPPSRITWDIREDWLQVLHHFVDSGRTDFKPISTTPRGIIYG